MTTIAHHGPQGPAGMISVEEARARILEHFAPLSVERAPLVDVLGQVLAEDVRAGFSIPPMANTSMDGYAVRLARSRSLPSGRVWPIAVPGGTAGACQPRVGW